MTRRTGAVAIAAVAAVAAAVPAAWAQVIQPPPRQTRAAQAPAITQALSASGSLLGSFEDGSQGSTPLGGFAPGVPTFGGLRAGTNGDRYSGYGNVALQYSIGSSDRNLSATGGGFTTTLGRNNRLLYGGDAGVRARTSLGRRMTFGIGHSLRSDPLSDLGIFGGTTASANPPGTNPLNGLVASRSWSERSNGELARTWTRRLRTNLSYSRDRRTLDDELGFDDRSQSAGFNLDYSIGRGGGLLANYQFTKRRFTQPGSTAGPVSYLESQALATGFRTEIWLTRSRALSLEVTGGATHVLQRNTLPGAAFSPWTPSGNATLGMGLGRTWSVSANYQRSYIVLPRPEPGVYLTDGFSGSIGGMLGSRLEQTFSLSHTAGRRPDQLVGKVTYITTTGTAQLRFVLTQQLSALVSYTHLRFHLDSPPVPYPSGLEMHRHSARVGLTWSQPLFGGGRRGRN